MRKALDWLYAASGYAAAAFIVGITGLVAAQVFLNLADKLDSFIFGRALGLTIPSYASFTGFFLAAASFLALAHTLRSGGHIRVSLVTQLFPPKAQRVSEGISLLFGLSISGYATYYVFGLVMDSLKYGDRSSGMVSVPIWIPQVPVLVGLAILTIALADELVTVLRGKSPTYEGQGENLLSE